MNIEYSIGDKHYKTNANHLHFSVCEDGRVLVIVVKKVKGRYLESVCLDAKDVHVVYGRKHEL